MQVEKVILNSKIDLLIDNLNTLKCIERDKSIPHSNPMEGVMEVKQLLSGTGTANTINHSVTTNKNVPFTYTYNQNK